jgi:hypothetical protein
LIYDMQGKAVYEQKLDTNHLINTKLNAGIYIIQLVGSTTVLSRKLIVQ